MRVLVVGGGGREHALCWKLAQAPTLSALFCAPGNPGIAAVATCVPLEAEDLDGLEALATREAIDLVIVGPEAPLVAGLADRLRTKGIRVFGPSAAAARIEGSKGFMKDLCSEAGIPTAAYGRFTDLQEAKAFVHAQGAPIVVKADGLAAGKGVILCATEAEALDALDSMMTHKTFGEAGTDVVIEAFLTGQEISVFALVDGARAVWFGSAQDHKAVGEGDTGPNTGGMGAYGPTPLLNADDEQAIMASCIVPLVTTMARRGTPFTGVLFAGLMLTDSGPKVLEYNVRFGDPECQVLMSRLDADLLAILDAASQGTLDPALVRWKPEVAMVVVLAAKGYPGRYTKGSVIEGLEDASAIPGVTVFHAGTALNDAGDIVANGGRVLGVTGAGPDLRTARDTAYAGVDAIRWADGFCRRDIGFRVLS